MESYIPKTYREILEYNGYNFKARIKGKPVEGVISIEDRKVFFCQDSYIGNTANNCHGYYHSWVMLEFNSDSVSDIEIITAFSYDTTTEEGPIGDITIIDEVGDSNDISYKHFIVVVQTPKVIDSYELY